VRTSRQSPFPLTGALLTSEQTSPLHSASGTLQLSNGAYYLRILSTATPIITHNYCMRRKLRIRAASEHQSSKHLSFSDVYMKHVGNNASSLLLLRHSSELGRARATPRNSRFIQRITSDDPLLIAIERKRVSVRKYGSISRCVTRISTNNHKVGDVACTQLGGEPPLTCWFSTR
jgi:hypothetical protein